MVVVVVLVEELRIGEWGMGWGGWRVLWMW